MGERGWEDAAAAAESGWAWDLSVVISVRSFSGNLTLVWMLLEGLSWLGAQVMWMERHAICQSGELFREVVSMDLEADSAWTASDTDATASPDEASGDA